jgi:hypothetical protein
MNLKSFGCSFVFGSDLPDVYPGKTKIPLHSQQTWPALLAKKLHRSYQCFALPGSGNLQILERLLNNCQLGSEDMFVIAWTWIDRFDYFDPNSPLSVELHLEPMHHWHTILPTDSNSKSTYYYKHLHSQYQDKLSTLIYMKTAIDCLISNNQKFIMTYMDNILFEPETVRNPAITYLQNYVKPYMTDFEGVNFLDWSRDHGYDISDAWHPLQQAHSAAADLVFRSFDKQNTNDPAQQVLF